MRFCYTKHPHSTVVNEYLPHLEKQEMLAHRLVSKEPEDVVIQICEKMNQSNRLVKEGNFHLAILQGCLVINEIFDQLLTKSSKKDVSISKTFNKEMNYLLALDLKLEVLKDIEHEFTQQYGTKILKNLIIAMKKFFPTNKRKSVDFGEKVSKKGIELVNDLFTKFMIYFVGEDGLKNCRELQFIYLHPPML